MNIIKWSTTCLFVNERWKQPTVDVDTLAEQNKFFPNNWCTKRTVSTDRDTLKTDTSYHITSYHILFVILILHQKTDRRKAFCEFLCLPHSDSNFRLQSRYRKLFVLEYMHFHDTYVVEENSYLKSQKNGSTRWWVKKKQQEWKHDMILKGHLLHDTHDMERLLTCILIDIRQARKKNSDRTRWYHSSR